MAGNGRTTDLVASIRIAALVALGILTSLALVGCTPKQNIWASSQEDTFSFVFCDRFAASIINVTQWEFADGKKRDLGTWEFGADKIVSFAPETVISSDEAPTGMAFTKNGARSEATGTLVTVVTQNSSGAQTHNASFRVQDLREDEWTDVNGDYSSSPCRT